jgi:leucyl/phenylalanyl-tRNA--protein transferase
VIPWLATDDPFPPVERALEHPNGLLCAGGDLSIDRLLDAYRHGIFPWYSGSEPILWWSPDPRMVLFTDELKVSRSLAKSIRNKGYEVRFDTAFDAVLAGCAAPRDAADALDALDALNAADVPGAGTWLGAPMRRAYVALHDAGHAHSVETWRDGRLVGGLYGVALGHMFYGESMFSRAVDASKVALVALVERLRAHGFPLIDCQVRTPLLAGLGAREIPRREFLQRVTTLVHYAEPAQRWAGENAGMGCAPRRRAGSGKR